MILLIAVTFRSIPSEEVFGEVRGDRYRILIVLCLVFLLILVVGIIVVFVVMIIIVICRHGVLSLILWGCAFPQIL